MEHKHKKKLKEAVTKANKKRSKEIKGNLFCNYTSGRVLVKMFLSNSENITYSDLKDEYISPVNWSCSLRKRLEKAKLITFNDNSQENIIKGGKRKFKFNRNNFLIQFYEHFIEFCNNEILNSVGEPIYSYFRKKLKKTKGEEELLTLKWGNRKQIEEAISWVVWKYNVNIIDLKIKKKHEHLKKKMNQLYEDDAKNNGKKIEKIESQLMKESYELISKPLIKLMNEHKKEKVSIDYKLKEIKYYIKSEVIGKMKTDMEKMNIEEVLSPITRLFYKVGKEFIKKKCKFRIYDVFARIVQLMGKEYKDKTKRKIINEKFTDLGIQRLYEIAWLYDVFVVNSFE